MAVAGALAHDLYARTLRPNAEPRQRQLAFQLRRWRPARWRSAGLQVERFYINMLVGWAFAICGQPFFPLLVLGIWWQRLTVVGAAAGTCWAAGSASARS